MLACRQLLPPSLEYFRNIQTASWFTVLRQLFSHDTSQENLIVLAASSIWTTLKSLRARLFAKTLEGEKDAAIPSTRISTDRSLKFIRTHPSSASVAPCGRGKICRQT